MNCEPLGCIYNQDGACSYLNAPLQFPESRACNEPLYLEDEE